MELFAASSQWATRPDDERFATIADLTTATKHYANFARESTVKYGQLAVIADGTEVKVVGPSANPARLTHWAFGQLSARLGAPAEYLRTLPAQLAVDNLSHGFTRRDLDSSAKLLIHSNGSLLVRAFTGEGYARIWNYEVAERLQPLMDAGWTVPPSYTDAEKPSGLYASDHDMFAFLVNQDRGIREPGQPGQLYRGVFIENSEVGASSLRCTRFLLREVCGNHIVWGATEVIEMAIRHVGDINSKASSFFAQVREYADDSANDDEAKIKRAFNFKIGDTKEEVLDRIFGKGILSRKQTDAAYEIAEKVEQLDPRTAWGLAQGVTRIARDLPFADTRVALEKKAGAILQMAF